MSAISMKGNFATSVKIKYFYFIHFKINILNIHFKISPSKELFYSFIEINI